MRKAQILRKAKNHQKAARTLYRERLYSDSVSRSYYAIYSIMWAYIGPPPRGSWTHSGVQENFSKVLFSKGFPKDELRNVNKDIAHIYNLRIQADYSTVIVNKQDAKSALDFIKEIGKVAKSCL
jgi:Uncharacterized conserved protein related to C-terminal domain of eukaryotic chaperone, SACSIN